MLTRTAALAFGERSYSLGEIEALTDGLAASLRERGVEKGSASR